MIETKTLSPSLGVEVTGVEDQLRGDGRRSLVIGATAGHVVEEGALV